MTLEEIEWNTEDQGRGADCHIVSPFDGQPTGIIFRICGPDSLAAQRAQLLFNDERVEAAEGSTGRVSAAEFESLYIRHLARLVVDLTAEETAGKRLALSTENLTKLLRVPWLRAQVDEFAGNRANFAPGGR
ncbi:hypothetical protein [Rhizobium sp. BE258]|uniref:hypothetical protein n=1 Tax=Rhizobium sp. BE258 TaxID=2817722 RepID=UPI002859CE53|nr:hypothetical protein [Rhizobium sp. BE258]MDR7147063.1 hypothetical protein [Rhizobium sp. BE258]